ncbi:amino acid/polyamine/organocation transporter (APC superfamily) [Rathayibacter sp. PhB185]|nr:amino acid/polyamine/organocation transporter (APC superfamily) [Rathayibacter sp. PhB186]ROS48627.1 amino acid/polyamine/organocation transporter (APC superfamily) [Rathayibacter sp. PhB185]
MVMPVDTPVAEPARLRGSLGPTAIVFMVVAAAAPLTVVAASPIGMALTNGGGVPANYLIAGVVLLLFAVGFTAMAHHIKDAGAFYSFIGAGLGRVAGSGAAFLALFTYLAIQTAIYAFFGFSTSALLDGLGVTGTPWTLWSALAIAVVGLLGYRDIDLSAKVLGVLLVLEVLVIVVLAVAVLAGGGSEAEGVTVASFSPAVVLSGPVGLGVMMAFGGYTGFESTAIFRDEARDPKRTIPRATYAAVLAIGVFYTLATWALVVAWGTGGLKGLALEHTGDLLQLTATTYVGSWLAETIAVLLCTSLLACVISFHNVVSRYLHSLGRTGLLPASLAGTHAAHGSPHRASVVVTVISVLLLGVWTASGWDPLLQVFTWISSVGAIGIILLFVLASVAVIAFFARTRLDRRVWNTVVAPVLALIGLVAVLVLAVTNFPTLTGSTDPVLNATLAGGPLLALALGVLVAIRVRRAHPLRWALVRFDLSEPAAPIDAPRATTGV